MATSANTGVGGQDPVLHLRGHIELVKGVVTDEVWVAGGVVLDGPPARVTQMPATHAPSAGAASDIRMLEGWVVPGLVDVHAHIGLVAEGASDDATAERQAIAARDSGVLLIRDAGSPIDTSWVNARADLPRLIRAGRHIARPKRYSRGFASEVSDDALADEVSRQAELGSGWVKIVADWIDRDAGHGDLSPLWSPGALKGAVAAAHAAGARVTAHTFATESIDALLDAGVDCIEHGTGLTPAQIARVVDQGIAVTPTLQQVALFETFAAQGEAKFPRYAARMRAMHTRRYDLVRELYEAGVRLLVGTDAGGLQEHGTIANEIAEMAHAGIPMRDVLAMASWDTREYLGAPAMAPGESADLVVYPRDPASDPTVLAEPAAVILRGRIVAGSLAE